ncbi:sarcosine oxidase subunit gamma [Amorphus sp. 3PC139-8]|uniref:sarcosine oxidase subunit gamma n=1 Tax=Amorphus sp. 3PC139-8 TaxID=2735676 RepID=UPI00345DE566
MADAADPFAGRLAEGRSGGRRGEPAIVLAQIDPPAAAQLQIWPGKREAVAKALAPIGITLPEGRDLSNHFGRLCGRIAPGRYLVLTADTVADVAAAISADLGAVADLSHARAAVRISGPAVEDLLAKGTALAFDADAFPPGTLAQTSIHHMGCLILRRSETVFDLFVFTSFALSFSEWLTDAAREFGWRTDPSVAIDQVPAHSS